jgi:hypothetical protein
VPAVGARPNAVLAPQRVARQTDCTANDSASPADVAIIASANAPPIYVKRPIPAATPAP